MNENHCRIQRTFNIDLEMQKIVVLMAFSSKSEQLFQGGYNTGREEGIAINLTNTCSLTNSKNLSTSNLILISLSQNDQMSE